MGTNDSRNVSRTLTVEAPYRGGQGEDLPPVRAYLFNRAGNLVDSQRLDKEATFSVPADARYRVLVGPDVLDDPRHPPVDLQAQLTKARAISRDVVATADARVTVPLYKSIVRCWWKTCIFVHGSVRKLLNPGGAIPQYSPICRGLVQIFQVDLGCTLDRIAPPDLIRLRDGLVGALRGERIAEKTIIPSRIIPDPPPDFRVTRLATARRLAAGGTAAAQSSAAGGMVMSDLSSASAAADTVAAVRSAVSPSDLATTLVNLHDTVRLRRVLNDQKLQLWPLLCLFIPDSAFCWQELATVPLQSDGTFSTEICFWCPLDFPDLYFEVVQRISGVDIEISDPEIACSTYYGYDGSQPVDIIVADPRAIACIPDGGDDPSGQPWILLRSFYDESFGMITRLNHPDPAGGAPAGYPDQGKVAISSPILRTPIQAPWGGVLPIRMLNHRSLPTPQVTYYRWSYRFAGDASFQPIVTPVAHSYMVDTADGGIEIRHENLGPRTVGTTENLFAFPDHAHQWVIYNSDADTTFAYFDTTEGRVDTVDTSTTDGVSARRSGLCTLMLEIFDNAGNLAKCTNPPGPSTLGAHPTDPAGPGVFRFLLPQEGTNTNSPASIDNPPAPATNVTAHGRLYFQILVDNNDVIAHIESVTRGVGGPRADDCGFLHFGSPSDDITVNYRARQHNGYLDWGLSINRGFCGTVVASDGQGNPPGSPSALTRSAGALLAPFGSCAGCAQGAAFALDLACWSWSFNGRSFLYSHSEQDAFALLNP
jgi:hypothetical protein